MDSELVVIGAVPFSERHNALLWLPHKFIIICSHPLSVSDNASLYMF